jgi:hypothetical protein
MDKDVLMLMHEEGVQGGIYEVYVHGYWGGWWWLVRYRIQP